MGPTPFTRFSPDGADSSLIDESQLPIDGATSEFSRHSSRAAMNKVLGAIFAIACVATSAVSGSILGVGMWFWIIIAAGVVVAVTQFIPSTRLIGSVVALLLSIVSLLAVALTLLAATIGGSFRLGTSESLLVFGFAMIAVFGIALVRFNRKAVKTRDFES
jgi:hypothetical protein